MIKFTSTPDDFSPCKSPVLYSVASTDSTPETVTVRIIDPDTEREYGSKIITVINAAMFDIAPYIREVLQSEPDTETGSHWNTAVCAKVVVELQSTSGTVRSDVLYLSSNLCPVEMPQLLTSMPLRRTIPRGEVDELLLFAPFGSTMKVCISTDNSENDTCSTFLASDGVLRFVIDTCEYTSAVDALHLTIKCDNLFVEEIDYLIVDENPRSVLVAWLSATGSIERYAFPTEVSSRLCSTRRNDETADGEGLCRVSGYRVRRLRSAYECRAVAEALAAIACSPKVWIYDSNGLRRVQLLSQNVDLSYGREVQTIEIEISEPIND